MPNIITHKRSSTSGVVPAASGLSQGELAINIADGKFYTKNNANSVINLGVTSISGTYITPASGTFQTIQFNTNVQPDLLRGQIGWNDTEGTVNIALTDNTDIHIGQHNFYRVRNATGSGLYKGQAVYATGVHANGIITPSLYVANGSVREIRFIGLILEDISDNNNGYAIQFGHVTEIDTRGNVASNIAVGNETWADGDILYVHPTVSGKLTNVEPKHSISTAIILDAASNGKIFVRPTSYGHLNDNHDVNVSGATNGQFLQYNSSTDYWVPSSSGNFSTLLVNGTGVISSSGGTTNYISKFTGGSTIANSLIFDNGTNVGIGTASPGYKLQVNGNFGATTKSFRIDHPSKKNHSLEYGSLESPYHGVRLTGRDKVIKGVGTVSLPDYLKDLIHDDDTLNIQITNIKHGKTIYIDKIDLKNDRFIVKADRSKTLGNLEFFWTLSGVRKDVDNLVVEKRN
jgi:hypothetical protein